jgi:hypothetical protein
MSTEHYNRIAWGLFFTLGLIALAWLFTSWAVLLPVLAFVLYFTLTKKA